MEVQGGGLYMEGEVEGLYRGGLGGGLGLVDCGAVDISSFWLSHPSTQHSPTL